MADPEEACGPRPGESCTAPHPAGLAAPPCSLWDSTTSPAESPWLTNELLWKQTLMGCAPDRQMGCANMGINRLGLAAACSPLGTGDTEDAGHGKGEAARPPRSTAVGLVLLTCPARQVSETGALAHQSRSCTGPRCCPLLAQPYRGLWMKESQTSPPQGHTATPSRQSPHVGFSHSKLHEQSS